MNRESICHTLHLVTDISLNVVTVMEYMFSCVENKHELIIGTFYKYKFQGVELMVWVSKVSLFDIHSFLIQTASGEGKSALFLFSLLI